MMTQDIYNETKSARQSARTSIKTLRKCIEFHDPASTHSNELEEQFSVFQKKRQQWTPVLPEVLRGPVVAVNVEEHCLATDEDAQVLSELFPNLWGSSFVKFVPKTESQGWGEHPPLRIGVVLSGGQAPGGHNVIAGLYDYIKQCNPNSQLFGFLGGPYGVYSHEYIEISDQFMNKFRNQGGFDMICSGRHKIETPEQKAASMQICKKLDLHGIIVVGGDDSNTNACILAEHFAANNCSAKVIGCPKTIDGDLKNAYAECSFGFDTAVKVYSELIGNLMTDCATAKNHYHFVRLMGRSASNIALECALNTRPNLVFIGEEVKEKNISLRGLVKEAADMIVARQSQGKYYGVVLLPEGLIEFIPEMGVLISEINEILCTGAFDGGLLTENSAKVFDLLPPVIREELLLERDPHGNVQVARIATERLLILMIESELERRGKRDKFVPVPHYFGYEGRCALPTLFDSNYCYSLGHTAAALVDQGRTGYMSVVRGLKDDVKDWRPAGCPLAIMMNMERRKGRLVPVIKKFLVELDKAPFLPFAQVREQWKYRDCYTCPGPIQYDGPTSNSVASLVRGGATVEELLPTPPFADETLKYKFNFVKAYNYLSPLQKLRLSSVIAIPSALLDNRSRLIKANKILPGDFPTHNAVTRAHPLQTALHKWHTYNLSLEHESSIESIEELRPRVGVVLAGQQSPGCSNVLVGMYERLLLHRGELIGYKGITGLLANDGIDIKRDDITSHVNMGGFELLGRTEETEPIVRQEEGLVKIYNTCVKAKLNGLVIIGGTHALTDVAVISEYFLRVGCTTIVVGVPATQNNNINHTMIESCIGFDSTSKCYSSLVGNLLTDAASATKYWYFVRLMGRDRSYGLLECALTTHPNVTIVSEQYSQEDASLDDVVTEIANVVCSRATEGKNFGTVLVPEGLFLHLNQMKMLITELDKFLIGQSNDVWPQLERELVACTPPHNDPKMGKYSSQLSPWCWALLCSLPEFFRQQLVQLRSSGRVHLTRIATEELLSQLVAVKLKKMKLEGTYTGTFSPVCHYFGYQGRSTIPSNIDCALGLCNGYLSVVCVESNITGSVTSVRGLCGHPSTWRLAAFPVASLLRNAPERETLTYGRGGPIVPSMQVDLSGRAYRRYKAATEHWAHGDRFCNPGPIQFGHTEETENHTCWNGTIAWRVEPCCLPYDFTRSMFEGHFEYLKMLDKVEKMAANVLATCAFGVDERTLRTAAISLDSLSKLLRCEQDSKDHIPFN
eukprot:GHVR01172161.1.p1 GENE.GHVR01172161.1~~GHVR01172161.1.p1  ORF type:complete len:1248 (+),score=290.09 GHVR01172161.1:34-3777(+)